MLRYDPRDTGLSDDGADAYTFTDIDADPVLGSLASMAAPSDDDETWMEVRLAAALRRAPARPDAARRHHIAALRLGWPLPADLPRVAAPTLVVHGERDLVLPLAHAEALAAGVPGARLVVVDGLGHLPTRRQWVAIADLVAGHVGAVADPVSPPS